MEFVSAKHATQETKEAMAELLFETSYLEYCSVGNKLNLHKTQLQVLQNINPYLNLCECVYNAANELVGFYIGGTIKDFNQIVIPSNYRDEIQLLDDAYNDFVHGKLHEHDYFLSSLAIDKKFRSTGRYKLFHNEILRQAKSLGCERIILTVWETSKAVPIYQKYGFTTIGLFEYPYKLFFENLLLMELRLKN